MSTKVPKTAEPCDHTGAGSFVAEYYGWRCSKCGVFYPNTAPLGAWLNGETYDGKDNDCEESDPR
jgi:ribosomal protein S27AE